MDDGSDVQFKGGREGERFWVSVTGPLDLGDQEVKMTSLAVKVTDLDFTERYAAYRNELAKQQKKQIKQQWSKKSQLEAFLSSQCDGTRHQLREMFAELGELPDANDPKAVSAYVARVIAWDKKHNK